MRIAAGISTVEYTLPRLLEVFLRAHPAVQVSILSTTNRDRIIAQVAGGEVEVGIVTREIGPILHVLSVFPLPVEGEEIGVIAHPTHRWVTAGRPITLDELAAEPVILQEPPSVIRRLVTAELARLGIHRLRVRMELSSNEAVKASIRAGLGVGFLPLPAVAAELERGKLARVEVEGLRVLRHWDVIHRPGADQHPTVGQLLRFLRTFRPRAARPARRATA